VSTRSSPTDKSKPTESQSTETCTEKLTEKSTEKSRKILLKPPIKSNYEVDRMVTEADFERRSPSQAASLSQCHLPMATDREIYHEALNEGSGERKCT